MPSSSDSGGRRPRDHRHPDGTPGGDHGGEWGSGLTSRGMPEMTLQQAYDTAVGHQRAGRLREAEEIYRQLLVYQPEHVDAMLMMARLEHQLGRHDAAAGLLRRVVALRPGVAEYYG